MTSPLPAFAEFTCEARIFSTLPSGRMRKAKLAAEFPTLLFPCAKPAIWADKEASTAALSETAICAATFWSVDKVSEAKLILLKFGSTETAAK